ncbi:hypothetical protein [Nostoc sp. DedVER01b]|uniref:hypothetical protein n=1 Tax=Nostoc sp. DedVER01b TaxID=3075404 RepID=UPI003D16060C
MALYTLHPSLIHKLRICDRSDRIISKSVLASALAFSYTITSCSFFLKKDVCTKDTFNTRETTLLFNNS